MQDPLAMMGSNDDTASSSAFYDTDLPAASASHQRTPSLDSATPSTSASASATSLAADPHFADVPMSTDDAPPMPAPASSRAKSGSCGTGGRSKNKPVPAAGAAGAGLEDVTDHAADDDDGGHDEGAKKKYRITRYPCGPCIEHNRTCVFTPAKRRGPPPRHTVAPPELVPSLPGSKSAAGGKGKGDASDACSEPRRRKRSPSPAHAAAPAQPSSDAGSSADHAAAPAAAAAAASSSDPSAPATSGAAAAAPRLAVPPITATGITAAPSMGREDMLREVNELSEKMTLVVSLDEQGKTAHISNLGHAGGLHLFRNWTRTFRSSDGLVYIPDLSCCHPTLAELTVHKILFPNASFVELMVNFYFDQVHPFLPFISRAKVEAHLASETPSYVLLYAVLAVASQQFERRYRLGPVHGVLVSHLLMGRAKALIQPMLSSPTPCLLNIQALLLMEIADRESPRGSPWLISGMAIRMALDLGLNLGIPDSFKERKLVSIPVWSKTWIYCCVVDSLNSFLTGRSHMISDADSVQDLEECLLNETNIEAHGEAELIPQNHFFVWLFKLFEITGKIGRTITSIRIRRNLPYSLPELHSLLSKYRAQLPKSLVYDFERPHKNSIFAVHLNLLYLGTVIFLYRTVFACNLLVTSPLRVEYMRILESSVEAILTIFGAHLDTVHLTPLPLGYAFDLIFTVCVILMSHDAERNKSKTVRILSQCLQLLDSLATAQPLLRRLATLGKELLESITGTVQDCDRDRQLLVDHIEMIKASEQRVAEWATDPLVERREADLAFVGHLSVPRNAAVPGNAAAAAAAAAASEASGMPPPACTPHPSTAATPAPIPIPAAASQQQQASMWSVAPDTASSLGTSAPSASYTPASFAHAAQVFPGPPSPPPQHHHQFAAPSMDQHHHQRHQHAHPHVGMVGFQHHPHQHHAHHDQYAQARPPQPQQQFVYAYSTQAMPGGNPVPVPIQVPGPGHHHQHPHQHHAMQHHHPHHPMAGHVLAGSPPSTSAPMQHPPSYVYASGMATYMATPVGPPQHLYSATPAPASAPNQQPAVSNAAGSGCGGATGFQPMLGSASVLDLPTFPAELFTNDVTMLETPAAAAAPGGGQHQQQAAQQQGGGGGGGGGSGDSMFDFSFRG
ncbi:hypothetical protein H9P43_004758 [Blastocladiella emersonii ATCC 22665]|nr:hypothetical protein H9P43_004758 [Blastocladiella emersonii ATCC 22665]